MIQFNILCITEAKVITIWFILTGSMATIFLPSTIFSDTHLPDGKETVGVFFTCTLYEVTTLFPVSMDNIDSERTREVGSFILGATVGRGVDIGQTNDSKSSKCQCQ